MQLSSLVLKSIENNSPIFYHELLAKAVKRGISEDEFDEVMLKVHKDRRVKKSVVKDGIKYRWSPPVVKLPGSHLSWVKNNYPVNNLPEPFPEIDMSWIVLSPEEMKQYKADAKGVPIHMLKSKHGKGRKRYSAWDHKIFKV